MRGRFTTGSTARHVVVMALTGSLGLITVFLVDFIDIYFIAQLNDPNKTAAVGFALNLMFFVRAAGPVHRRWHPGGPQSRRRPGTAGAAPRLPCHSLGGGSSKFA